jgi:UDPglucose--hexose-1-phosphate uridylyltransferase
MGSRMTNDEAHPEPALPEVRRDAVTGAWSILAVGRSRRPGAVPGQGAGEPVCPFCPGNESLTPPEVWADGRDGGSSDSPGWKVRVVPNLYPALMPEAGTRGWRRGGRTGRPAHGDHEVIIHSPEHERSLADMDLGEASRLIRAWLERYRYHAALPHVKQVQVIINHKREAGASLEHPHTQVFVLPMVPRAILDELCEARRRSEKGCLICAAPREAREDGRIVLENEEWTAYVPYASRAPFEVRFAPRRHNPDFAASDDSEIGGMADILTRTLKGLSGLLGDPPYNLWIHTAPCDGRDHSYFHWHVEMVPRVIISAGFELATGMFINILAPEEAARQLREAMEGETDK